MTPRTKADRDRAIAREFWRAEEYESAAEWCAMHGIAGHTGDRLPSNLSVEAHDQINADPVAFRAVVRLHAYAIAAQNMPVYS